MTNDNWWTEVYHPVLRSNIIRLIQSYGIRYNVLNGYFIGNKYIKVRADNKNHVKEIILSNEMLGGIPDLTLKIKEIKDD